MYKYKTRQLATPPTISSENISRYWYDDSAFKTGFLNSLSSLFEGGEKFFMKSLNYYTPQYPEYKKEKSFYGKKWYLVFIVTLLQI